jgi:hypothetical protein
MLFNDVRRQTLSKRWGIRLRNQARTLVLGAGKWLQYRSYLQMATPGKRSTPHFVIRAS